MTVTLLLMAVNMAMFFAILVMSAALWRREPSERVRPVWLLLALTMLASLAGTTHRFVLQAEHIGWISTLSDDLLLVQWQLAQSVAASILAVFAWITVVRASRSIKEMEDTYTNFERVAGWLMERAAQVDLKSLHFTGKEREVMTAIGRGMLTDKELAEALFIAQSTAQTHIKSLMRKTGLRRRQDLFALAILLESQEVGGSSPD